MNRHPSTTIVLGSNLLTRLPLPCPRLYDPSKMALVPIAGCPLTFAFSANRSVVGAYVNPQLRPSDEPRREDYLFEGYELEDALDAANEMLEDDVRVLEQDGRTADAKPFVRTELLGPLERWFFGR